MASATPGTLWAVLADHLAYEQILNEIFEAADGLTPAQVYDAFRKFGDRPFVAKYLALEFPHTPASLQNVMVTTMLQLVPRRSDFDRLNWASA